MADFMQYQREADTAFFKAEMEREIEKRKGKKSEGRKNNNFFIKACFSVKEEVIL